MAERLSYISYSGNLYAVGSNSKTLRICQYPSVSELKADHETYQPTGKISSLGEGVKCHT